MKICLHIWMEPCFELPLNQSSSQLTMLTVVASIFVVKRYATDDENGLKTAISVYLIYKIQQLLPTTVQ